MMPALTATQPTTGIQSADNIEWMRPARGFDAWCLRRDLLAADQVLDEWVRELETHQDVCTSMSSDAAINNDTRQGHKDTPPSKELLPCLVRALSVFGIAALPVGAGLVVGSFGGDLHHLWDWGLAAMVLGQTALLLASLADRKG